jgi:NAD(P)-dependent dehydrogenase (short-subunit alcohol dehydrogenase family)
LLTHFGSSDINLRGVFQCLQEAVKRMKVDDRGGSIVNIASVNSLRAVIFDNVHYWVTKAGLNNLTVSIALEHAPHNIRVNSVLPGGVSNERAMATTDLPPRGPVMQPRRIPSAVMSARRRTSPTPIRFLPAVSLATSPDNCWLSMADL